MKEININLIGQTLPLPRQGSWPEAVHVFDEPEVYALMAAEAAQRPLLIRGEPGTGKSQLARAAAVATDRLFVPVVVTSRTECQDLQWRYDAVGRLAEAQTLAHTINVDDIEKRMDPARFISPGPLWWVFDWHSASKQQTLCKSPLERPPPAPEGWQAKDGSVLLIDEIDKADAELPNGLLETLGNGAFSVPHLEGGSIRQTRDTPLSLVVITTNEERELPAAFLRRCLVLHLSLPQDDKDLLDLLCRRGAVHPGCRSSTEPVRRKAGRLLLEDRKAAVDEGLPPPGQAEYLDLLRAVCRLKQSEHDRLSLLDKIGVYALRKSPLLLR